MKTVMRTNDSLEDGDEEVDEEDVGDDEVDGHDGRNDPEAGNTRAVLCAVRR